MDTHRRQNIMSNIHDIRTMSTNFATLVLHTIMPIKFLASHNCIIFGPSRAGKTMHSYNKLCTGDLIEARSSNAKKHILHVCIKQAFMKKWSENEKTTDNLHQSSGLL